MGVVYQNKMQIMRLCSGCAFSVVCVITNVHSKMLRRCRALLWVKGVAKEKSGYIFGTNENKVKKIST